MKESRAGWFIHHLFLLLILFLPFVFWTSLEDGFLLPKEALLVIGSQLLLALTALWMRRPMRLELVVKRESLYLVLFIAAMGISVAYSSSTMHGLREFLPFYAAFCLFAVFIIYYHNSDPSNRGQLAILKVIVLAAFLQALLTTGQFLAGAFGLVGEFEGRWRVLGTFGNPNYVIEFILPGFFLAINLLQNEERPYMQTLYKAAVVLMAWGVFATVSRSGLLLLLAGCLLYAFYYSRAAKEALRPFITRLVSLHRVTVAAIAVGFLLIVVVLPVLNLDGSLLRQVTDRSRVDSRFFIWRNSLQAALDALPFGAGIGDYAPALAETQFHHFSEGHTDYLEFGATIDYAHNDPLQFIVELGVGAVFFFLFVIRVIRKSRRTLAPDDFSVGIFVGWLVLLGSTAANYPLRIAPGMLVFFLLSAFINRHRTLSESARHVITIDTAKPAVRRVLVGIVLVSLFVIHFPLRFLVSSRSLRSGQNAEQAGDLAVARDAYAHAVSVDSGNRGALAHHARLLRFSGDGRAALALFEDVAERAILPNLALEYAGSLADAGHVAEGLAVLARRMISYRGNLEYAADYLERLVAHGSNRAFGEEYEKILPVVANLPRAYGRRREAQLAAVGRILAAGLGASPSEMHVAATGATALLPDGDGFLVALTGIGLCRYSKAENRLVPVARNGAGPTLVNALQRSGDTLWVGADDGLWRGRPADAGTGEYVFERLTIPGYVKTVLPVTALAATTNLLWAVSPSALTIVDSGSDRIRTLHAVQGQPLSGLCSAAFHEGTVYIGGYGMLLTGSTNGEFSLHPIRSSGDRSGVPVRVNAVHPFGEFLLGLCTDKGLLIYMPRGRQVVKSDFTEHELLDITVREKTVALLTAKGAVLLRDLTTLFLQISKDVLGRIDSSYAESMIQRRYDAVVPEKFVPNLVSTRVFLDPDEVLYAATGRGLMVQTSRYGAGRMIDAPGAGPGPWVHAMIAASGKPMVADDSGVWLFTGTAWTRLVSGGPPALLSAAPDPVFAIGADIYRVLEDGRAQRIQQAASPVTALAASGENLAWVDEKTRLHLTTNGKPAGERLLEIPVESLAFSGRQIAAGGQRGLTVYEPGAGLAPVRAVERDGGVPHDSIRALAGSDGWILAAAGEGGAVSWHPESGKLARLLPTSLLDPATALSTAEGWFFLARGTALAIGRNPELPPVLLAPERNRPFPVSGAVLAGDDLFVSGGGGLYQYRGFRRMLAPWQRFFE